MDWQDELEEYVYQKWLDAEFRLKDDPVFGRSRSFAVTGRMIENSDATYLAGVVKEAFFLGFEKGHEFITKGERLKAAGWRTGGIKEYLELTDEEVALVEKRHQNLKK